MLDAGNTPEFWDEYWRTKAQYMDTVSMKRCWFYVKEMKPKTILEIGSGSGRLLAGVKEIGECFGVDLSPVAIDRLKLKYGIKGRVLNAYDVDKLEKKFDFIIANNLIEHLYRPKEFLAKVEKLLNDKGTFFCSVPNDMCGPEETDKHTRTYNGKELAEMLTEIFGNAKTEVIGHHLMGICKKE